MAGFDADEDFISFGDEINSEPHSRHITAGDTQQDTVEDQYDHRGTERRRAFEQLQREGGYLNYKQNQHASSRIRPWTLEVDWEGCRNPSEMLHHEILAYVDYISPSEREHRTRAMIVKMITETITSRWPDALVQPFGSFETGLYLPLGDIDLVVSSDNIARNPNSLHWIARTLRDQGLANNVQVIAKAKVPIVKFVTTWGGFKVDISLNQANGVTAGKIINNFLARLPALRPLVLVFKAFLSQRDMNEVYNGGLGSYSVVCMVLSFLQLHPKIRNAEIDPSKNLGILLIELFQYYGDYFHYENTGISLRGGGQLFNKRARGWGIGLPRQNQSIVSIEDPQDPSNDVSRGSYNMHRIRTTLSGAHSALTTTMFERNDQLNAKREKRYTRLQKPDPVLDADAMSILGSILNVSQETINHRRMVAELYDSGALHDVVGVPFEPVSGAHQEPLPQPDPTKSPSLLARLGPASPKNERRSSKRQRSRSPKEYVVLDSDESAWDAADQGARAAAESGSDSEDGRYGVEPVRKRAKKGDEVVWISDDSDEDQAPKAGGGISIAGASKRAHQNGSKSTSAQDEKRERVDRRREYWRSKAPAGGNDHDLACPRHLLISFFLDAPIMTTRKDLSVSERIAALQRGSSPQPQGGPRHASPPGTPPNLPSSHSLKDKIAHFDALGSAPKPIGSFGLGGAPVVEHRNVNRELYGNRIPSVAHKSGRSDGGGKDILSGSSTSLDRDVLAHSTGSAHSAEVSEGNHGVPSPTGSGRDSLSAFESASATVPEIRRTDSMTERWVDNLQTKPTISLDTSSGPAGAFAPPSPVPDSDDTHAPAGPTTPLTTTVIKHLSTSSHVPSRLGAETPMSIMVETGSLIDGEQPKLVPEDDNAPVPSSPVVTGMQALGLSDDHAEGETTPTREDESPKDSLAPNSSLALPSSSTGLDEGPNTPLARPAEVEGTIAPAQLSGDMPSGLGVSIGEQSIPPEGSRLTATNVHQLDGQSQGSPRPSGPSSVVVEPGSVLPSPSPSPAPEQQQTGARTPEPASALTPKQALSDLPALAQGSVPLSAATLRLLDVEETPMSVLVETGSTDGKRDLEGVDPPVATPAPASPSASYFDEPTAGVVVDPVEFETKKDIPSTEIANTKPDNRSREQGPPVPPKDVPTIITNIQEAGDADDTVKTPTNTKETSSPTTFQPSTTSSSRTLHKAHSRPNISTSSTLSASAIPPASAQTLAAPNSGLQRRATTGSNNSKTTQRRRVSRVPQMQLLPSGQWGVVGDDSDDDEDTGGWAKVTVSKSRWS
ncbi:DNA polymerase sigma subunit [Ceratobasidium sp. AG-Ba]|nr:DNA polymerase sigma subunit [Ceratobasidium sp. AG-Ba]